MKFIIERKDNNIMSYKKRRRSRVRYDRIAGVAAVFVVLIILLVSCCKSCGKDSQSKDDGSSSIVPTSSKEEKSEDKSSESTAGSNEESSPDDTDSAYTTVSAMPNEIYTGDLILVNKQHEYSFPASEEDAGITPIYTMISDSYQCKDYEISLASKTITALNSMMDAFYSKTNNTDIMVISGYRNKEYQDGLNDPDIKGGFSEYHTGLSFDLGVFPDSESSYYYTADGDYAWIAENCANYGFILRYPEDKEDKTEMDSKTYQFRYVGVPHAIYMKENNLCLEEYIDELKNHTSDGEHIKVTGGEKKYEIYYVPADPSANTDIPVPKDKSYSTSGNNVDGFIVTVEI